MVHKNCLDTCLRQNMMSDYDVILELARYCRTISSWIIVCIIFLLDVLTNCTAQSVLQLRNHVHTYWQNNIFCLRQLLLNETSMGPFGFIVIVLFDRHRHHDNFGTMCYLPHFPMLCHSSIITYYRAISWWWLLGARFVLHTIHIFCDNVLLDILAYHTIKPFFR